MINAINLVSSALKSYQKSLIKDNGNNQNLIQSINDVAQAKNLRSNLIIFESSINTSKKVNAINETTSLLTSDIKIPTSINILRSLNRSRDENLHSDFLWASIKENPEIVNFLALKGELISVKRELRLDQINSSLEGSNLGMKRIDLFIETDKSVMIIENKIDTLESRSQTQDYFECVQGSYTKEIHGVLLSPKGLIPDCDQFRKMTYYQLFLILNKINSNKPIINQYLSELYNEFVKPYNRRT